MTSKAAGLIVAVALFAPALAAATPGHGPAVKAAVKACVQERKQGREAFDNWGGNENGANAFGKCVSGTLHQAEENETAEEPEAPEVPEGGSA